MCFSWICFPYQNEVFKNEFKQPRPVIKSFNHQRMDLNYGNTRRFHPSDDIFLALISSFSSNYYRHQSLKTISGTLESPISEEGIDGVEESEVGWSGETVILTPLNNNFNTTYACTGKIQITAPNHNSEFRSG